MEKYQPSNGTEGMIFIEKFCDNCINGNDCSILNDTMVYNINDKKYPKEWVYLDDKPTCTAFVKWDRDNDGDPNDRNNPKVPIDDPNQLMLFSIADEIFEKQELTINN